MSQVNLTKDAKMHMMYPFTSHLQLKIQSRYFIKWYDFEQFKQIDIQVGQGDLDGAIVSPLIPASKTSNENSVKVLDSMI